MARVRSSSTWKASQSAASRLVSAPIETTLRNPTRGPSASTASPSMGLERTVGTAERLAAAGYTVVPHLAARMVSGRAELVELVDRLTAAGITNVFVPGGDADPVGDYHDAVSLLEDLTAIGSPFAHVGVTGYPESHPKIHDDLTVQSDRKSTRLNSSHTDISRMPSSA